MIGQSYTASFLAAVWSRGILPIFSCVAATACYDVSQLKCIARVAAKGMPRDISRKQDVWQCLCTWFKASCARNIIIVPFCPKLTQELALRV
eukprot:4686562-Amphidinium_carterae.2